jgi:Flp pilus assembly protein TadD
LAAAAPSTPSDDAKPSTPLLVRATARSVDRGDDTKLRLSDARSAARDHATDPRALKAWATAAMRAGETREARRAAEAWAVHDSGAEPRLFLAGALEHAGRKREARAVLEEWLANHPDSADAKRMVSHLGAAPEPAIKRGSRGRPGRPPLHPQDPVAADE